MPSPQLAFPIAMSPRETEKAGAKLICYSRLRGHTGNYNRVRAVLQVILCDCMSTSWELEIAGTLIVLDGIGLRRGGSLQHKLECFFGSVSMEMLHLMHP